MIPLSARVQPLIEGHFALHDTLGMSSRTIQRLMKELANRARIRRNLLTREFHLQEGAAGDGKHTVAYIEWCQSLYPGKKLLFLWEGASYHRGAELQEFLGRENTGLREEDWKVTCVLFTPNAPEQNPTEDIRLKGKQYLRKHFAVNKTFASVKRCFSAFLSSLSFDSAKLRWYWPEQQMS